MIPCLSDVEVNLSVCCLAKPADLLCIFPNLPASALQTAQRGRRLGLRPSMKAVSSSETAASYPMGPTSNEMFRRVAYFVDKILKGTKQTELPIERPSHFELFVNVKTAKALGLNVPPTLLARADEVIE